MQRTKHGPNGASPLISVLSGRPPENDAVSRRVGSRQLGAVCAASIAMAACGPYRGVRMYEVPEGYVGWVEIKYGDSRCAPLPVEDGHAIRRIPPSGILCTSTALRDGWGPNQYFEVGRSKVEIPTSGDVTDRRIWSPMSGELSYPTYKYLTEAFFVGTWSQQEANMNDLGRLHALDDDPIGGSQAPDNNQMQRTRPTQTPEPRR